MIFEVPLLLNECWKIPVRYFFVKLCIALLNMAFAAHLQENAISVAQAGGTFAHFLSPTVEFLYEPPGPTMEHLLLLQKKMTCMPYKCPGDGGMGMLGID